MSAFKYPVGRQPTGELPQAGTPGERRLGHDRRGGDRRARVIPFESRETRLRFAAQAAGFGTYDLDCITGESVWSPELRTMAGLPPDTLPLSMEQAEALIHPEDRRRFLEEIRASLAPGGSGDFEAECRLLRPDGGIRWIRAKGRAFFGGEGPARRPLAATGVVMDITASREAEQALEESQEDLELAVRGSGIGIWNWDLRTGKVEFSGRCHQLFGIPEDESLIIQRVLAAIHPDDREHIEEALRRTLEQGEEYKTEKRVVWPDGSVHWLECIGRDLCDEVSHKAVGMRGISLDITGRKAIEEALRHSKADLESRVEERTAELMRANEALEKSNLELQQFAFITAHDLQTPLRSINGFAQLLQKDYKGRLDAQADAWLDQLTHSARRMYDICHDIQVYSRIESRGSAFHPTDCRQLFEDVVANLDAPIRESKATVTRDELPVVMADRMQLAQVLQNLIDNGIKYHGGEPPRIHVSARRQGAEWLFSVRDRGIGIAERHLESIFDIFRRLHTEQEYPGTGIGLAVCRRVVLRHGGRIWAESEPGKGSTFYFTLPIREGMAP